MLPQRPSNSAPLPPTAARKSDPLPFPQTGQSFEAITARVLAKLKDRLDPGTSKRMPASLLRQSLRSHAEQVAEQEARGLPRPQRDRIVEAVLAELLGYGPLQELFDDPTVREIMVTGPHAVIARRDQGDWLPTNTRFRDEDHLRGVLDKLGGHADPVGPMIPSLNTFDLKLPNGFRVVAVIPPPALGVSPTAAFVRTETVTGPANPPGPPSAPAATVPAGVGGSASNATRPTGPGSATASPRPGSGPVPVPPARTTPAPAPSPDSDPLLRHRDRIIERLISRLASLGVYDLQRVEVTELRKIVAAYVAEYLRGEKIYLSDTDEGRLQLEILTAMHR